MQIFYKKKGAISVFLSVILLPTLIFAMLATDAARIYCSKSVISDAGELAMNAALAQYDADLKDEYGLIAMEKKPSAMKSDLEKYFTNSLNGSGLSDAGSYQEILDLVEQDFEVLDVEASKVYKTEVEKQQILEYMKYRAPVCMAEMVLDKIDEIKDTKKKVEAMEAEADFTEAMEDCQDAFEDAKQALDNLNSLIDAFPSAEMVNKELDHTQRYYTTDMSKALLMRAVISNYNDYDQNKVQQSTTPQKKYDAMKSAIDSFMTSADKVNLSNPLDRTTFDNFIDAMYYRNTIERIGTGKVDDLLGWYDELKGEASSGNEDSDAQDGSDSDSGDTTDADREALSTKIQNYKTKRDAITPATYSSTLYNNAKDIVDTYSGKLSGIRANAESAEAAASSAYKKLEKVKKKLEDAAKKHKVWKEKTNALDDPGSMKDEVEEYEDLLDTSKCEALMSTVKDDQSYFKKIEEDIDKEKFYDMSIAKKDTASQLKKYKSEAENQMKNKGCYYDDVESERTEYISKYEHTSLSYTIKGIASDDFYKKLIEYCSSTESEQKEEKKSEANEKLDEGTQGAEEATSEDGLPTFDWSGVSESLPSHLLGYSSYSKSTDGLTNASSGNIDKKGDRRNIIKNVKESIRQASSFLDGLDRVLSDAVENLYIAEYAMQMFTYYTVDKQVDDSHKIKTLSGDDLTSLSGYKFTTSSHKAYRAEVEYILWGKSSSAKNVLATMSVIYGIRLIFNMFYALTDKDVNMNATAIAAPWASVAPYLEPIIKIVYKMALALCETTDDILDIKTGFGVSLTKDKKTWVTMKETLSLMNADNTKGMVNIDYSEYLRIFLYTAMFATGCEPALARIGDCIQVNVKDDITNMYTMVSVEAKVTNRTTFMRKIADWSGSGWTYGDRYSIDYKSVLGY